MRVEASTGSVSSVIADEETASSAVPSVEVVATGSDDVALPDRASQPSPTPAAVSIVPSAGGPARAPSAPRVVRLRVPFVSQAPFRVWSVPYKEFCEEASMYTLHLWKQKKPTPPADALDRALKGIQQWETEHLGTWEDTTAAQAVRVLREYFGYSDTRAVRDVTIESLKRELDAGHPVIVPAAGRMLPNPYFQRPGPLYHMLVVIGYDDAAREFITHDVGTNTKGAGLRYRYQDFYRAMGDWSTERQQPDTTQKVMIVVP